MFLHGLRRHVRAQFVRQMRLRMPFQKVGLDDLAELLKPMEKAPCVGREREVFSLLVLQMLDLLLLRLDLFPQWLDDGIGEDVARLRGDVRGILAAAGDGADDGPDSPATDQGDEKRRPEFRA